MQAKNIPIPDVCLSCGLRSIYLHTKKHNTHSLLTFEFSVIMATEEHTNSNLVDCSTSWKVWTVILWTVFLDDEQ